MMLSMSIYEEMDAVIRARVQAARSTLFTEWAGAEARFFHLPGSQPFECFQISIEPPTKGRVRVLVAAIDSNDGEEPEQVWEGPAADLDSFLASALTTIERWKTRPTS